MTECKNFFWRAILIFWKHIPLYQECRNSGVEIKALLSLLILTVAFSVTSLIQAASGNFPAVPLLLPLSLENYFFWQSVLALPWMAFGLALTSSLVWLILRLLSGRNINFKQIFTLEVLSLLPAFSFLWLTHFLTAIFYALGGSQKEWVDLVSVPGWFQSVYLFLIILSFISGLLVFNLNFLGMKFTRKKSSRLVAGNLSFWLWIILIIIFVR